MIYFTDNEIERLLEDDLPLGDMTSYLLQIDGEASIQMKAREDLVICGVEEAVRLYQKLGIRVLDYLSSGTKVAKGEVFLKAEGSASQVHQVWRSGGVMVEYASGIATRTAFLVNEAKKINPDVTVAGTRKHPPYLKKVALKALLSGGGVPHRTGLSDTILLFKEHIDFDGGYENLSSIIAKIKSKQKERKIVVEAHTQEQAEYVCRSGADAIQIDKMSPDSFKHCVEKCKQIKPLIIMIAAGGVNGKNIANYAAAGADVLVTSCMYYGPLADIKVNILSKGDL